MVAEAEDQTMPEEQEYVEAYRFSQQANPHTAFQHHVLYVPGEYAIWYGGLFDSPRLVTNKANLENHQKQIEEEGAKEEYGVSLPRDHYDALIAKAREITDLEAKMHDDRKTLSASNLEFDELMEATPRPVDE